MALSDEVMSRYGTQFLVGLTNPQASTATTVGTTKLANACTDVEAEFAKVGITFAVATATHVVTACEGVIALLRKRAGQVGGWEEWKEWRDVQLERLRMVTTNDRIVPTTNSQLTPSDENPTNSDDVRPDFDNDEFTNIIPTKQRKTSYADYTSDS